MIDVHHTGMGWENPMMPETDCPENTGLHSLLMTMCQVAKE